MNSQKKVVLGIIAGFVVLISALIFLRSSASQRLFGFQLKMDSLGAFAFNKDAQTSLATSNVNKVDAPVAAESQITSPAAGDLWRTGNSYKISWNLPDTTDPVDIVVGPPHPACLDASPPCEIAEPPSFTIATGVANTGFYQWTIPANLSSQFQGQQQVTIKWKQNSQNLRSDIFSIVSTAGTLGTPTFMASASTVAQYVASGTGGATAGSRATYNFVSSGASSTINELTFSLGGTPKAVVSISISGTTVPVVNTVANVTGLNLSVPNGGSGLNVPVALNYAEVGINGIPPGSTSALILTYVKYTSGGVTNTLSGLKVAAPTMTLVGSEPALAVSSLPGTGLTLGAENKISDFFIQATNTRNIKVNDIKFNVSSSNITDFTITSPRISDGNLTIPGSACTAEPALLTTSVVCQFGSPSNTDFDGYTITGGATKTFRLYGTVTGTIKTVGASTTVSTSLNPSGFNWDDTSTNGASGTAFTGTLINPFPTNSYIIRQ